MKLEGCDLPLYSSLTRAIEESGQGAASGAQWLSWILGLRQKGISQTEIDWSEVVPWLKAQANQKISRETSQAFVQRANSCHVSIKRDIDDQYRPRVRLMEVPRKSSN